ncbi:helicase domain-containing protein [Deinococcus radiophilus]|uniref:hypothetical protein n=1 Tax=Deinococcus radiophilus TaxID=32062 RepID=UPI001E5AF040|nr:hypothetical protein [Deinococcus radiophilus]UFA52054.1 hypothetical protein LMT64_13970 [Deinococcus radiophilus]
MPHTHPAYPEEVGRLGQTCQEIDAKIGKLERQEMDLYQVAQFKGMDLDSLRSVAGHPYFMRLRLRYEDGSVKDVCLGEGVHDIPLSDTYICGIGSPLRQQIQHRQVREVEIVADSGAVRTAYQLLRRQLKIEQRTITALSDVMPLADGEGTEQETTDVFAQLGQEYLVDQLGREASAKARSILATISERQDELMSWPTDRLLVVNGVAGSGKTAIAYHRIPSMLHKERVGSREINEKKIAVFVPNSFLLGYLKQLLPRAGVNNVFQTTLEDWAKRVVNQGERRIRQLGDETAKIIFDPKSDVSEKQAAIAKAGMRGRQEMQMVLRHLLADHLTRQLADLSANLPRTGSSTGKCGPEDLTATGQAAPVLQLSLASVRELVEQWRGEPAEADWKSLRANLQTEVNRLIKKALPKEVALLAEREGQGPAVWISEVKGLTQRLGQLVEGLLPTTGAWETYLLLVSDEQKVSAAASRIFTGPALKVATEALHRTPKPVGEDGTRPFEPTDVTELPLVLALKILLEGVRPNDAALRDRFGSSGQFDYLVLDEGQDLSPLQYALLRRYTPAGRAAIFGDLRQGIHRYRGIGSWDVVCQTFGTGEDEVEELTQTFRTTQEITALGNFVLERVAPNALKAEAVPRPGSPVHFVRYSTKNHLLPLLTHEVRRLQREGAKNIGIVTRSPAEASNLYERVSKSKTAFKVDSRTKDFEDYAGGVAIVPISVAKGLEFDAAIVVNADVDHYNPAMPYDGSLLYTCVTRGLHHLTLFALNEFTPLLGEIPSPEAGKCPISGLEITDKGFHKPPTHAAGRTRRKGQERGPGANQDGMVRTYDGRFDSMPSYEGDGSRDNPWYDR